MTLHYRTEGFTFRKENRLEADRVFSVFTKDFGRIEVFGRTIRKINSKLRPNIEIFSLSEIEFIQGKNKKTLTNTLFLERFKNISEVPEKLEIAFNIAYILDNFIKGEEKDEKILELIVDTFEKLNNHTLSTKNYSLVYYYFLWNFIFVLGYGPELSKCAVCQQKLNPYGLYFSNREGGVICKNCFILKKDGLKIKSDTVKVLRLILEREWDIFLRLKIETSWQNLLKEVSDNYCDYLLYINSFKSNSYLVK